MRALRLIDSAAYGPETLKAMGQAFDEAWREIADKCGDDPQSIELARLRLADALLSVACEDSHDVEVLKQGALDAMALADRRMVAS
jgi:alkylhydroperoxidase family enzyme